MQSGQSESCRWWRTTLGAALVCALSASGVDADAPFLIRLRGDVQDIQYSHGTLDRAARIQSRLETIAHDLFQRHKIAGSVGIVVVTREDWDRLGVAGSYGLPQSLAGQIVAPAWGDQESVALWSRLLDGRLPMPSAMPLIGSPEEAASMALADLVLVLRYGDALLRSAGYEGDRPWVLRAVAGLLVRDSLGRIEPARSLEIEQMLAVLEAIDPPPAELVHEIDAWRHGGALEPKRGRRLKKMMKAARGAGGRLSASAVEALLAPE